MKTIISVILTVVMVSSTVVAAPADTRMNQDLPSYSFTSSDIFKRFNIHRQQNGVALQWVVNNSEAISSFIIERSWDGVYFESVDVIPASEAMNRYFDNNEIYPGFWYYRITAVLNDGTEVTSETEMLRIVRNG